LGGKTEGSPADKGGVKKKASVPRQARVKKKSPGRRENKKSSRKGGTPKQREKSLDQGLEVPQKQWLSLVMQDL